MRFLGSIRFVVHPLFFIAESLKINGFAPKKCYKKKKERHSSDARSL